MAELEKVIKGLECCSEKQNCKDCPYFKFSASCQDDMNKDALELLKEYKRQDKCPCTHCQEYACEAVCNEYKKWHKSYME